MAFSPSVSSLHHHYLKYLLTVAQSHSVTLACNLTVEGDVFASGSSISKELVEKLCHARRAETQLGVFKIEGALDASILYQDIVGSMQEDASFRDLFEIHNSHEKVQGLCDKACAIPVVCELLSTLKLGLPKTYSKSLFVAWWAIIALRNNNSEEDIFETFLAGLLHDVGLLFLDPSLLVDREWGLEQAGHWQQHPLLACELLEFVEGLPYATVRAIAEHHERLDGSGYPTGRVAKQLNWRGQLILLLDSCYAVYTRYFKSHDRTLPDIIPIVQMNAPTRSDKAANAFIMALRAGKGTESCSIPLENMSSLIKCVKDRHDYIKAVLDCGEALKDSVGLLVSNARIFAIQNTLEYIGIAMRQSGLINEAYMRWLVQVEVEKLVHAYREVEDVFLMMQEVLYHIGRLKKQMRACAASRLSPELKSQFDAILAAVESLQEPSLPKEIAACWEAEPLKV